MTSIRKVLAAATVAALLAGPFGVFAATDGPTVTLSSSAPFTAPANPGDSNVTWADPIPFSVTISSSTTEFDASDIRVTGGSVLNFSGSGTSYTFQVDPGDGDPLHANDQRYVQVVIDADKFSGNQASAPVAFWFNPAAAPVDAQAPVISFVDPSPADGATVHTASDTATTTGFTFAFTVDDAGAAVLCSIVGSTEADNFYSCGSPQAFSNFPVGSYRFTVKATDTANNVATSSRAITVAIGTSTPVAPTTPTPPPTTNTPAQSSGGGGGGGNGMVVGSSPIAPGGPGLGNFVNPNPIIVPTAGPDLTLPGIPNTGSSISNGESYGTVTIVQPAPRAKVLSGSAAGRSTALARAAANPTATPAPAAASAPTTTVAAAEPTDPAPGIPNTAGQSAQAGAADIPTSVWLWGAIVLVVLAAVGWLFYRAA